MSSLLLAENRAADSRVSVLVTSSPSGKPGSESDDNRNENNTLLSEQLGISEYSWAESEVTTINPLPSHGLSRSQQSLSLEYSLPGLKSSRSTCELERKGELSQDSYSLHSLPLRSMLPAPSGSTGLPTKSCWTLEGPSVHSNLLQALRATHKTNPLLIPSQSFRSAPPIDMPPIQLIYAASFTFVCVCNQTYSRFESTRSSIESCPTPPSNSSKPSGGILKRMRSFLSTRHKAADHLQNRRTTTELSSYLRSVSCGSTEQPYVSRKYVDCVGFPDAQAIGTMHSNLKNLSTLRNHKGIYSDMSTMESVVTCDHVHQISLAAKHAIDRLRYELRSLRWDDSQCRTLTDAFTELSSLIPCPQFATEFIKASGHEVIFRFVETFQPSDQQQQTGDHRSSVWSALMACLATLAEYGINSADDEFGRETKATITCSLNNSDTAIGQEEDSENLEDNSTFVCPVFNPTLNELFSWHLVSDLFLSVIMRKCSEECNMVTLKNELNVLLKILINCPARANAVIGQTGPEFIFDRLQTVHELTLDSGNETGGPPTPSAFSKTEGAMLHASSRSSLSSTEGSNFWLSGPLPGRSDGPGSECLSERFNNPLRIELIALLLEFVYIILYRAHVAGTLAVILPDYLNAHTLPKLVTYLPQLKITNGSDPFGNESNRDSRRISSNTLKRQTDFVASSCTTMRRNSFHRGGSNFFYQTRTLSKPDPCNATNAFAVTGPNPFLIMARLQRLQFALLAEEAEAVVDLENSSIREQIRHWLLKACASDRTYLPLIDEQLEPLSTDAHPTLGRLQLNCLRAFLTTKAALVPQILSCGRSRSRDTVGPKLQLAPSIDFPVSRRASCKLRPSQSDLLSRLLPEVRRKTHPDVFLDQSIDDLSFLITGTQSNKLMFPLIEVSSALTRLLCHLLAIDGHVEPFDQTMVDTSDYASSRFHVMFLQPRTSEISAFEDLFVITMCVFFYAWTQLNAVPEDLNGVLLVLHEQLLHVVHQGPVSLDQFEQFLNQRTPQVVLAEWKHSDQTRRDEMQQSHPVLKDLNAYLTMAHQGHVREQRLNAMSYSAPLEYVPLKNQRQQGRDNVKYHIYLSPDRNSLILYDQQHRTQDLWPLTCIERVTTGTEERIKKNPERTIVLRVTIRDTSEQDDWSLGLPSQPGRSHTIQPQLVARTSVEYNYWLDGLYILRMVNRPSEQFAKDIQRLVALDMKLRISGLDLSLLPSKPRQIPLDPPEFDFDQP